MTQRETETHSYGLTAIRAADGEFLSYREGEGGIKLYRGIANLRRLAQKFDPTTFRGIYGSRYGEPIIEHKLAGLVIAGTQGVYYGLDTNDLNQYMRATGGIFPVEEGEDLPDTLKIQLESGTFVYFPTEQLLDKFGVQRRQPTT